MGPLPLGTDSDAGFGLIRIEAGDFVETFASASLNRQLFFSGPIVSVYDGQTLLDDGSPRLPVIESGAGTIIGGGAMPLGTFLYTVVFEWIDGLGYRHLSAPSLPFSVTLAGAQNAATVEVTIPAVTPKTIGNAARQMAVRLYRTQAGGTIFYDVANATYTIGQNFFLSCVDTFSDTTIATHEILYTQGARGGLSGLHERDCAPAARYITAGSSRLLLGGMDNPYQVQWSLLQFDGEPMYWANDAQWRATVDGRISAVAELDGTWIIGTLDTIWTVNGDGPDDNGAGSFGLPKRLPSSVGILSHKSIIKFGGGLLYQSRRGFELIPRGGGEPQWIGEPMRDTLLLFPYVTAAVFNQAEQVAYWAVCDASATVGRLIVYDVVLREWYVDTFYGRVIRALSVYDGKLVIDGAIRESSAWTDDDTGAKTDAVAAIASLVTGDLRPFGPTGWGRIKKTQILGEARDVGVSWSLTLDVSYDSGQTFSESATPWPVASLATAPGDAIDGADHAFIIQRTNRIRLRFGISAPSPTEGMVFHGVQLEIAPADGSKRQPSSMRAA
jgi:regulator of extracellular matrix RemA (YlzA/DUF370 family)